MDIEMLFDVLSVGSFGLLFFVAGQLVQSRVMGNFGWARVALMAFFALLILAPLMCASFAFGLLFPRQALQRRIPAIQEKHLAEAQH